MNKILLSFDLSFTGTGMVAIEYNDLYFKELSALCYGRKIGEKTFQNIYKVGKELINDIIDIHKPIVDKFDDVNIVIETPIPSMVFSAGTWLFSALFIDNLKSTFGDKIESIRLSPTSLLSILIKSRKHKKKDLLKVSNEIRASLGLSQLKDHNIGDAFIHSLSFLKQYDYISNALENLNYLDAYNKQKGGVLYERLSKNER